MFSCTENIIRKKTQETLLYIFYICIRKCKKMQFFDDGFVVAAFCYWIFFRAIKCTIVVYRKPSARMQFMECEGKSFGWVSFLWLCYLSLFGASERIKVEDSNYVSREFSIFLLKTPSFNRITTSPFLTKRINRIFRFKLPQKSKCYEGTLN